MDNDTLLSRLAAYDNEVYEALVEATDAQLSTLSLIPTTNAVSPFSAFLKGSVLGNEFLDHHAALKHNRLEKMAAERAEKLFAAEHAIVRLGSLTAASRVVLHALAQTGDTILSFNRRKEEYCTGDVLKYNFVPFAVEPGTFEIDFKKVKALAQEHKPKIIIYSPVNYPKIIDCHVLANIAREVGAYLWVDLGQNVGLVASRTIKSPVSYADVVTFAASDALHGPQNGIILAKKVIGDLIEQVTIDTGHVSLKSNVLAALAIAFAEASSEEYGAYSRQVIENAKALERGLNESGVETLCSPTENHLVLPVVKSAEKGEKIAAELAKAGLLVKAEKLLTANPNITYPILRLSSLEPTTRSLKAKDMERLGKNLGDFIQSAQTAADVAKMKTFIEKLVMNLPLFSEEWLPDAESDTKSSDDMMMKAMLYWNM